MVISVFFQIFELKHQNKPDYYTLDSTDGDKMSLRQYKGLKTDVPDGLTEEELDDYYWDDIIPGKLGPIQYVVDLEEEEVAKGSVSIRAHPFLFRQLLAPCHKTAESRNVILYSSKGHINELYAVEFPSS